jgi:broad specificity phosphatase PhoE
MTLKLYFLRHGQTPFSQENKFCGSLDAEMTKEGDQMAEAFAAAYSGLSWQAVFVSPRKRTIATARPFCAKVGLEMQIRPGLQEIHYGQWEGKTVSEVDKEFHDDYLKWSADPAWHPPTRGELAVAIAYRALQVVDEIKQRYPTGNVLVVSQKATIRIILCSLLGIDVGRFRYRLGCPVSAVSMVEFGIHGPLLEVLGDRTHLTPELLALPGT